MPKLELWKLSSEPVKIEYLSSHSQKSPNQLKQSTKHETEKNLVSSISNFQKSNTSRTLNSGQETKEFKTTRGSSRQQTAKKKEKKSCHSPPVTNLNDSKQLHNYLKEAKKSETHDSNADEENTVFEEYVLN